MSGPVEPDYSSWTFEQLIGELESVARAMEAGDIGIEAAVDLYERAGSLHQAATARLEDVQARIEQLRVNEPNP